MKEPGITVIILAGGRSDAALTEYIGTPHRALAKLNGETLIKKVISAVEAVNCHLQSVYIVGDIPSHDNCISLPDQGDFVSNLFQGLLQCDADTYALIMTADIPFVTEASLNLFLEESFRLCLGGAEMVWPVIPVEQCYTKYPGITRTSLNLKEGKLTGGNLALVNPSALINQREKIASAYLARKSIFKLAVLLGPGTLIRLFLSILGMKSVMNIPYLERCITRLIGSNSKALQCNCPDLATDLDRIEDFIAAEKLISC